MAAALVVLAFDGKETADGVLDNFRDMQERGIITLEDVVVAKRGQSTEVHIHQTDARRGRHAAAGASVGALAGWLIAGPVGGVAAASVGSIIGALRDRGIDDGFVREVSDSLKPESSAIFLLIKDADGPAVMEELKGFNALVVHTTLSPEQERKLRDTLHS